METSSVDDDIHHVDGGSGLKLSNGGSDAAVKKKKKNLNYNHVGRGGGGGVDRGVIYKECMRNHAAAQGGYALDGCGEFMHSSSSFSCAACGCHRNFHRRIPSSPNNSAVSSSAAMLLALSHQQLRRENSNKKIGNSKAIRIRSKFSREQKELMKELSEKIGWRMQKKDEGLIEEWCRERIGVSKSVFKVWMHNNKHNFIPNPSSSARARKASSSSNYNPSVSAAAAAAAVGFGSHGEVLNVGIGSNKGDTNMTGKDDAHDDDDDDKIEKDSSADDQELLDH